MNEQATGLPPDAELVARAKAGDREAVHALARRHYQAVYRLALYILNNEADAADASQDAFVKALRALHTFRGESAFRTWLLTIAANEARGRLRKVKRRKEAPLEVSGDVASGEQGALERVTVVSEAARVKTALDALPEKQRMAVTLRIYEGLSFKEVGEAIGSSEGSARVNYHHGVRKLREFMSHE